MRRFTRTWVISGRSAISVSAGSRSSRPALVLVYLEQGALVLADLTAAENPLFPPVSDLAVGACNSSDDGCDRGRKSRLCCPAPSLSVQQAIQLGAIPRLEVRRTSQGHGWPGLCAPQVNWLLATLVLCPRLWFSLVRRPCQRLCGIAVAGDMMVTTLCWS